MRWIKIIKEILSIDPPHLCDNSNVMMDIEALKQSLRSVGAQHADRESRVRRIFLEERAAAFDNARDAEFNIKTEVSTYFDVPYAAVKFCGSAHIGFSIHKDRLFVPGVSDLDIAIVDANLFQYAWQSIIQCTRSFSDLTSFARKSQDSIDRFKDQIVKRGMINIDSMPNSEISQDWKVFQNRLGRQYVPLFSRMSVAIYLNEYAFCWKQDSAISRIVRG